MEFSLHFMVYTSNMGCENDKIDLTEKKGGLGVQDYKIST